MSRYSDFLLTALAPAIWGSTYIITTELLPDGYPITVAMLRALPAGLLLLGITRQLPKGAWWGKAFILGGLNFAIFWALLFVAAYRLPGGVAGTLGAVQPLIAIFLARAFLGKPIAFAAIVAALAGLVGVALLVLTPNATLDPVGILAGIGSSFAMATGTVLSRRWQPPVGLLTFTGWQLTAGGVLLIPLMLVIEPAWPPFDTGAVLGIGYLSVVGAAFTYVLWFRGVARIEPAAMTTLLFFSPITAVILGWSILGQTLSLMQFAGILTVMGSIWVSLRVAQKARARAI